MTRKELVKRIATSLHDNGIRKPIAAKKTTFHISDDSGNAKDFVVRQTEKTTMYTINDVEAIIDAAIEVICNALKHGEVVTVRNLGSLGLKYRQPRKTKRPMTDEWVEIPGHYIPKFIFGSDLRMAAKQYELLLDENQYSEPLPLFDEDSEED